MKKYICLSFVLLYSVFTYGQFSGTVSTGGRKQVLVEMGVGAWCGPCADGDNVMRNIKDSVPSPILVQIHTGDSMEMPAGNTWEQSYIATGIPMIAVDRSVNTAGGPGIEVIDRTHWASAINERAAKAAKYDISMTYAIDVATRAITINLSAKALAALTGEYRFNAYIVEDSVTGTGTGYDQRNYYGNTAGHIYFGLPDPIIGFHHRHVLREMLGTTWGDLATTNPAINTISKKTYSYTLPAKYNINRIKIVGAIMKYNSTDKNDREVMNAVATSYTSTPLEPVSICIVKRDSATNKNMVIWERGSIKRAAKFNIYREDNSSGVYNLVGSQPTKTFSTFIDTGSHPEMNSNRYKLTLTDTFGQELLLDSVVAHRTVYISSYTSGTDITLNWNLYEGRPFTTASIMESVNGGPFTSIATLPSTTTTYKITSPSSAGIYSYRLDIAIPAGCGPSKTTAYDVISSNVVYPFPVSVKNSISQKKLSITPNPATQIAKLTGIAYGDMVVVYDFMGRVMYQAVNERDQNFIDVDVHTLSPGVYTIHVKKNNGMSENARFEKL